MSMPLRHLPVVQHFDCHSCSHCCREYDVAVTDEERRRIEAQEWRNDEEVGNARLFVRRRWWSSSYKLNHRKDRGCIFLSADNRCKIHERFGPQAKPLACRLFPFVLVPAKDHWRVGLRYACPSVANNLGKPVAEQSNELNQYVREYEERQHLREKELPLPVLQGRKRVEWQDLFRFLKALEKVTANRNDRVERRLRKWSALANLCRKASFDSIQGSRLSEFLKLVVPALDDEVPEKSRDVARPGWIGRLLFRQLLAVYGRKDRGEMRGIAARGRVALFAASCRFAFGGGRIPQINARIGPLTFAEVEENKGPLPIAAERVLERYYLVKLQSLQFFGPTHFGLPFWDGLEALALTYPLIVWLARTVSSDSLEEGVVQALSIVDDHFGYNPILKKRRYRYVHRTLARQGEIPRLIAWYG